MGEIALSSFNRGGGRRRKRIIPIRFPNHIRTRTGEVEAALAG